MFNPTEAPLLLVEDCEDALALSLRAFRLAQVTHQIVIARDGVEALEWMRSVGRDELPALVVLDLKLPRLDGLGVIRAMRADQHIRAVPVLMLSASVLHDDLLACYDGGADSYMVKPVDFVEFARNVVHVMHYWMAHGVFPAPEMPR